MGTYSPGSAWILQLWCTKSNPGPEARTTTSTDHVCGLGVLQGQNRAQCRARLGEAVGCVRTGWTRARQRRQWAATVAAALVVRCCGGGGTARSGLGAHGRTAGLWS